MADTDDDRLLERLIAVTESNVEIVNTLIGLTGSLKQRDEELGDGLADLDRRLSFITSRARLVFSMKATTLTLTCLRCACEFATEPGPQLCGPCWTELGRPDRYLAAVAPAPSTERNEPA